MHNTLSVYINICIDPLLSLGLCNDFFNNHIVPHFNFDLDGQISMVIHINLRSLKMF